METKCEILSDGLTCARHNMSHPFQNEMELTRPLHKFSGIPKDEFDVRFQHLFNMIKWFNWSRKIYICRNFIKKISSIANRNDRYDQIYDYKQCYNDECVFALINKAKKR